MNILKMYVKILVPRWMDQDLLADAALRAIDVVIDIRKLER